MRPTIRANTATWMVFAAILLMGLTPLWAAGPTGSGGAKSQSLSPSSGKGEGVVNVPSMPEPNQSQTGDFGANGCRVTTTMTLGSGGVVLVLPAEVPQVVVTYQSMGVPVTATVQDGLLHFDTSSLEALREVGVERVDIVMAASQNQYVRARLELPPGTDQVMVRIE